MRRCCSPPIWRSRRREALRGPGTLRLIRFAPDGSDSGGQEVIVTTGGKGVKISVQWLTGQVSVTDAG